MVEHNGSIFVATAKGINEISIINHSVIPDTDKRFEPLFRFNIYDMVADSEFIYLATNNGLLKMDWKDGNLENLSIKDFRKIKLNEQNITGTDGNLWFLKEGVEEKYITSNVHDFDICGSYIWSCKGGQATLLDTMTAQTWVYDSEDGIPGNKIYEVNCDDEWAWFLTNGGIAFYNWSRYHNKKN